VSNNQDISIGENQWIDWVEFDALAANPTDIDNLLKPTIDFWKKLETECVAPCCGIDAFAFWPADIEKASANFDDKWIILELTKLKKGISEIDNSVIVSTLLNQLIHKNVFLRLLDHLIHHVRTVE